ncbi:MAG: toll/interleukin-1 receptor domain-containing protein [Hyphomicrobiaceae bacterium]
MPRSRRTYEQIFLDLLGQLANGGLFPNAKLREALDWDESRYNRVKTQLVESNSIVLGKGQGGSVGLAKNKTSQKLRVFISYSHADEELKNKLLQHLEPLKRLHLVESWDDREIKAGDNWGEEIAKNLDEADIILLLVSIDFVNSEYCYDIEMERALERSEDGEAVVIPVILRSCLWKSAPFAKLQAIPTDGKAASSWADQDEAYANIADGIKQAAERLIASRAS